MKLSKHSLTTALVLSTAAVGSAQQDGGDGTYRFNGPTADIQLNGQKYEWDGGEKISNFKEAIEDPVLFGPEGIFETNFNIRIANTPLSAEDFADGILQFPGSNKEFDCFVSYHLLNLDISDAQSTTVVNFFLEGGDLLLINSDSSHDEVAEKLFVPTLVTLAAEENLSGDKFAFNGAFGTANNVKTDKPGKLREEDVLATNGIPFAYNPSGEVIAAVWPEGRYLNNPATGTMIIITDRDIAANENANYGGAANSNGIFMLNTLAVLMGASRSGDAPYGCGFNPPGSLQVLQGEPKLGQEIVLGVDNPYGTQGAGAFSGLMISTQPHSFYPSCGTGFPNAGMTFPGSSGELLVSITPPNPIVFLPGEVWMDDGPAEIPLPIPLNLDLLDITLYAQGLIVDPSYQFGIELGLARAMELRLGL